jgi:uncharacterized protein (DUF2252 family)
MRELASMRSLDLWYSRIDVDEIAEVARKQGTAKQIARLDKNLAKTRAKDSLRAFNKLTTMVDGEPRIAADAPLIVPIEDLADGRDRKAIEEFIHGVIRGYRRTLQRDRRRLLERFRYVHAARKVVGVGSVGTQAMILLMVGRDDRDVLFLQAKEAQASVLERFVGVSEHSNHGQRVVVGQRLMQAASDIFLGWIRVKDLDGRSRDYYIRQLHDWKGGAEVETFRVAGARLYGRLCGATLARAHARWGDRLAIASYLGKSDVFDRAIADFSVAYADQNESDYEAFAAAVKSGRIAAQTGL